MTDKPELDALVAELRGCPTARVFQSSVFIRAASAISSLRLSLEAARGERDEWKRVSDSVARYNTQLKESMDRAWDVAEAGDKEERDSLRAQLSAANAKLAGARDRIEYRCLDGWHTFTCEAMPGLLVSSPDAAAACTDLPLVIQKLRELDAAALVEGGTKL